MEIKKRTHPLNVLDGSGQEALLAHILNAEHASKAQAVIDFRFGKRTFNTSGAVDWQIEIF